MNQFRRMNRRYKRISYLLGAITGLLLLLAIVLEFVSEIDMDIRVFLILFFSLIAVVVLLTLFLCIKSRKNVTSFNTYLNSLVPEGYTFETGSISCENLILESGYDTKKTVCASAKLEGSLSGISFEYYFLEFYKMREIIKAQKRNAGFYLFKAVVDDITEEKYIVSFNIEGQSFPKSFKCYQGNIANIYSQKEIGSNTLALPFSSFFISVSNGNVYMLIFDETDDFKLSHMHNQEEFIKSIQKKSHDVENMLYLIKEII